MQCIVEVYVHWHLRRYSILYHHNFQALWIVTMLCYFFLSRSHPLFVIQSTSGHMSALHAPRPAAAGLGRTVPGRHHGCHQDRALGDSHEKTGAVRCSATACVVLYIIWWSGWHGCFVISLLFLLLGAPTLPLSLIQSTHHAHCLHPFHPPMGL